MISNHVKFIKQAHLIASKNLGKTFPVLFEAENNNDVMYGFTENYIKVKTTFDDSLINEIKTVTLKEIDRDGLFLITFEHH